MANVTCSVHPVEREKRGYIALYLRFRRVDGDQGKEKIGVLWPKEKKGRPPKGYLTRGMAEAKRRRKIVELEDEVPATDSGATFLEATTEFLRFVREERQIDRKTANDYEGVINGYLLEEFGKDTPIAEITPDAVDEYKGRLLKEGKISNRTIVRHLTVLHGVFKRAKRKWGLVDNPASADLVERPKVVYTGEFDTLDRDEVELLATFADNPQDAAIFRVAAYTGLRQGELLALRWGAVDFVTGLIHVRKNFTGGEEKMPKGKRVRSVPMMPDVVTALATLKEREHFTGDDDLVFVNEVGEHVNHFELRKRFYAALEAAALRRIKFHDLRHAFGSAAITKLDPYAVQSYMGHQHYSTTQRYLHHKPREEDAAKLADAFGGNGVANGVANGAISDATERNSDQLAVPEKPQRKAS
jgi:integrase